MRLLEQLLAVPGSRLAEALHLGLAGLRGLLEEARSRHPDDPGLPACDELLTDLARLLRPVAYSPARASAPVAAAVPVPPPPPPRKPAAPAAVPAPSALPLPAPIALDLAALAVHESSARGSVPPSRGGLPELRRALLADRELRAWIRPADLGERDEDLWLRAHLAFLRLPAALADRCRAVALSTARQAGAEVDPNPPADCLPGLREEILCPSLRGTVTAEGLRTGPAPLPANLAAPPDDPDLVHLAGAVALVGRFLDRDPQLHHALKAVNPFSVSSAAASRAALERQLKRRYEAVLAHHGRGTVEELKARLDLDEVLGSLVYLPPADPETSWWAHWLAELRRPLARLVERFRQAGRSFDIRALQGPYADIVRQKLTAGPPSDLEVDGPGPPGHVAACLRVYAALDREVFPGRVLYYSATGSPS
jgi:hypothetical protein